MDHQFRNATLGGFNKQDVLDYLEKTVQEHNIQVQALQTQLDQAQEQCGQLSEQVRELTAQNDRLTQESQQDRQTLTQLLDQHGRCQEENKRLSAQLAESEQVRKALQEQVDKLLPDATAYAAVKDRTAGVELDAHRRAQLVIDQAQEEAQQIRGKVNQWLAKVEQEYIDLRSQVDATIAHASRELESANGLLTQISQRLEEQDAALEGLETVCAKGAPVTTKVPAPVPLPEE